MKKIAELCAGVTKHNKIYLALGGVVVAIVFAMAIRSSEPFGCAYRQAAIFRATVYAQVPDRANYAAEAWCVLHDGKPGVPQFTAK